MTTESGPFERLEAASTPHNHRFSISDMLLATFLASAPLACNRWIGWPAAVCLVMMALVLTIGLGRVGLLLMCSALALAACSYPALEPLRAFCITVVLILLITLSLVAHSVQGV